MKSDKEKIRDEIWELLNEFGKVAYNSRKITREGIKEMVELEEMLNESLTKEFGLYNEDYDDFFELDD